MNDVVAGAWRNGLDVKLRSEVEQVEARRDKGFLLLPYESTVARLAELLDAYDVLVEELLLAEDEDFPPTPVAVPKKKAA